MNGVTHRDRRGQDSVATIVDKINSANAGVTATFDATTTIQLVGTSDSEDEIVVANDTTGFLAAAHLASDNTVRGNLRDDEQVLAKTTQFAAVDERLVHDQRPSHLDRRRRRHRGYGGRSDQRRRSRRDRRRTIPCTDRVVLTTDVEQRRRRSTSRTTRRASSPSPVSLRTTPCAGTFATTSRCFPKPRSSPRWRPAPSRSTAFRFR